MATRTEAVADDVPLAHASFSIRGDGVVPDFWTEYFGLSPTSTRTKGELYRYPSGKLSTTPSKTGYWSFDSEQAVRSDHLAPHLRYLKSALALPRADLRQLIEQAGARVRFFCFWVNESGNRVPDVPDDIRAIADSMGIEIDIDEYR